MRIASLQRVNDVPINVHRKRGLEPQASVSYLPMNNLNVANIFSFHLLKDSKMLEPTNPFSVPIIHAAFRNSHKLIREVNRGGD